MGITSTVNIQGNVTGNNVVISGLTIVNGRVLNGVIIDPNTRYDLYYTIDGNEQHPLNQEPVTLEQVKDPAHAEIDRCETNSSRAKPYHQLVSKDVDDYMSDARIGKRIIVALFDNQMLNIKRVV